MTQTEINKGNELILLYEGAEFVNDAPEDYPEGYYTIDDPMEPEVSGFIVLKDCEYHHNWNWLIPVVKKLCMALTEYYGDPESIIHNEKAWEIQKVLVKCDIEPVWKKVIEGIELLNKSES